MGEPVANMLAPFQTGSGDGLAKRNTPLNKIHAEHEHHPTPAPAPVKRANTVAGSRSGIFARLALPGYQSDEDLSPLNKLRRRVTVLLNEPNSSRQASVLSFLLVMLIIVSVVVMVLSTVKSMSDLESFATMETIFAFLFTIELVIRCAVQYPIDSPQRYFKEMLSDMFFYVDALAVLPTYIAMMTNSTGDGIQILKALRVVRLFKLFRQFQGSITLAVAIEESMGALTVPFFFLVVSATTFGVFVYYIENIGVKMENGQDAEPTFSSIPHSIWFIFVTMTTVGYGDVSPVSALGRTVNIFAMVFGVLFLSMPLAILGNNFVLVWSERDRITVIARIKEALMKGGVNKRSIRQAFMAMDADFSGAVNQEEFIEALHQLKVGLSPKSIKKLWHTIDVDGSGELRIAEFAEMLFPEVEDGYNLEEGDESEDGHVEIVADPVLMKLLLGERNMAELSAKVLAMAESMERIERMLVLATGGGSGGVSLVGGGGGGVVVNQVARQSGGGGGEAISESYIATNAGGGLREGGDMSGVLGSTPGSEQQTPGDFYGAVPGGGSER